ncbi:Sec24-like 3 [Giardia duodenalis]|uniref:Sec24-like 3 n=1 Tax=Giardia intestinalis (strain ATCC 50803 / WB clone C6) TaxID=184922 RepID=A8B855_GIAIC|nr:Sec24-like 3 [Giardia intestinalis]KAE8305339.1 Sec24-like 3 [Giardia intestinalis]|eukprot:XP_001708950.1 Sec24 [Giardia lamblia ATCC 50803]
MTSRKASVLRPSARSSSTFARSSGELQGTVEGFVQDTFQRHGSVEPNASSMVMYMSLQRYKKGIQACTSPFMTMTHKVFPRNSALESQMKFSLGLIVEPLSAIGDTTVTLQQDTGLQLPRCSFCGAYINGYNRFTDTRTMVFCCICDELTRLPPAYSALLRNVNMTRPELSHEAYDYLCPAQTVGAGAECTELTSTSTGHACYYAIELTEYTIRTKKAIEVLTAVLGHLDYLVEIHNRHNCSICIGLLFFNTYVHVLARMSPSSQDLCIYSLVDRNTLPVPDGFLINISDLHSFNALYSFIKRTIHTLALKQTLSFVPPTLTQVRQTELAHALELITEILKPQGGRVIVFVSTQPKNLAPGQCDTSGRAACQDNHFNMKNRFSCLNAFYGDMAIRLVRLKISVSMVLMPASSVSSFGSVLELVRHTNGGLWYVERFSPHTAEVPIQLFLQREFGEATCFDVYCSLHLPKQISVKHVLGTVMHRSDVVIYLAAATQASCCGVRLQVHGELDGDIAYYQARTSFITFSGQRVIRVCTKPLRLSSDITKIITSVNPHVLLNMYVKLIAQTLRWSPHTSNPQELILNKHTDLFIVYASTLSETIDSATAGKVLRRNLRDCLALYHSTLPDVVCYQRSNIFKLDLVEGLRFLDYCPQLRALPDLVFSILKTDMLDLSPPRPESVVKSLISMITLEGITTVDMIAYLCPHLYYVDVTIPAPTDNEGIELPLLSSSLERPGVYLLESFYCLYVFININPISPLYNKLVFSKRSESTRSEQHTETQPAAPSCNIVEDDEQLKAISATESNYAQASSLKRSRFHAKPLASTRSHSTIREKLTAGYKGIKEFIRSPSLGLSNPRDDPRHPYTSVQIPFPRSLSVQPSVADKQRMNRDRRSKTKQPHETLYLRADSDAAARISATIDMVQKRVYETRGVQLNIIVVSSQGAYAEIIAEYMTLSDTARGISIDAFKQSIEDHILKSYDLLEE